MIVVVVVDVIVVVVVVGYAVKPLPSAFGGLFSLIVTLSWYLSILGGIFSWKLGTINVNK